MATKSILSHNQIKATPKQESLPKVVASHEISASPRRTEYKYSRKPRLTNTERARRSQFLGNGKHAGCKDPTGPLPYVPHPEYDPLGKLAKLRIRN